MWDSYALSTMYFIKLSRRLERGDGQRCEFATFDRRVAPYGYKVKNLVTQKWVHIIV